MQVTPSVRLISPLGAGGMGAVWLADHTALNTRVVVKFMLDNLDSSTSARTRFKREAEAASQVKSPHVVQTFDYGLTTDGVPFIVMEHLEGRDLGAEISARGALEPVMVIRIVSQVAKALSKAHAAGLLHRDIKPDNIFLCHGETDDELFVKLLDFGIAKTHTTDGEAALDGQTKTGQVIGTPFYMSPEQVTAQKVIDLRSDLWSLGIVAFEALTGKRPFDGPSFGALAVKIATTDPPKPSDENPALPPSVDAWFAQACARDPAGRFGSARELADKLRSSFEGVVSLPPAISGAMSDSGPRGGPVSGARLSKEAPLSVTPAGGVPAGPISVDNDGHDRPSFVLASTLSQDSNAGDRSALARSEPGGAAVAIGDRSDDPKTVRGGAGKGKLLVPVVVLCIITIALVVGWKAKEHSGDDKGTSTPGTSLTGLPTGSTALPPPATSEPAPIPSTTPLASAPTQPIADAAPSASAHVAPPVVPTHTGVRPPIKPTASAPSTKPTDTAPHPSVRPNTDPLF